MNLIRFAALSLVLVTAFACTSGSGEKNAGGSKTAGSASGTSGPGSKSAPTEKGLDVRVGYLAKHVRQHPIVASPGPDGGKERQFYLDLGDRPWKGVQIIIVYPHGMKIPREKNRKIELRGKASRISLGGRPGTKRSYSNEVLRLSSWRYLD